MKQKRTRGIILARTDYGEADRIITVLTPDYGKLRLMVRGARKVKSKLAGGIELFSISELSFIEGKGDMGTLTSSRLDKHFGEITKDISRVQAGYELIKLINKVTEDRPEASYFDLLCEALAALNDLSINLELIQAWFEAQLVKLAGNTPNLSTDALGAKLELKQKYNFDFESMSFKPANGGRFSPNNIKGLRLLFSQYSAANLVKIEGLDSQLGNLAPLIHAMLTSFVRV